MIFTYGENKAEAKGKKRRIQEMTAIFIKRHYTDTMASVWFFVPNLIGYARILLLVAASFFPRNPLFFLSLTGLSMGLDFFDGIAARKLNQCSKLGEWLDVVCDKYCFSILFSPFKTLFLLFSCNTLYQRK